MHICISIVCVHIHKHVYRHISTCKPIHAALARQNPPFWRFRGAPWGCKLLLQGLYQVVGGEARQEGAPVHAHACAWLARIPLLWVHVYMGLYRPCAYMYVYPCLAGWATRPLLKVFLAPQAPHKSPTEVHLYAEARAQLPLRGTALER